MRVWVPEGQQEGLHKAHVETLRGVPRQCLGAAVPGLLENPPDLGQQVVYKVVGKRRPAALAASHLEQHALHAGTLPPRGACAQTFLQGLLKARGHRVGGQTPPVDGPAAGRRKTASVDEGLGDTLSVGLERRPEPPPARPQRWPHQAVRFSFLVGRVSGGPVGPCDGQLVVGEQFVGLSRANAFE